MTEPYNVEGPNIPIPDPSKLTTELLRRELTNLRQIIEARLDGSDKATQLRLVTIEAMPDRIKEEVGHLETLQDAKFDNVKENLVRSNEIFELRIQSSSDVAAERFSAIAGQFTERDTRTEQAAQESRISLDAALAAAKEAVSEQNKANALAIGKSEDATKERLDALALLMNTSVASLNDRISDVKTRLDRGEGRDTGSDASVARTFAIVGVIGSLIGIILGIAALLKVFGG